MGFIVAGILIDQLPHQELGNKYSETDMLNISDSTNLCPKYLTISFSENSTYIFLESIYYKNINESSDLTSLETQICNIFPNSNVLIVVINETSDITGYSYLKSSKKIRTKMVAQGRPFLDFGDLNENEKMLHDQICRYFEKNPNTQAKLYEHTKNMTQLEKAKFELIFRDTLYAKLKKENNFEYLGGSLDKFCIEEILGSYFKTNWNIIEGQKSFTFNKKKFNFEKESIENYVYTAWNKSINPT